MTTLLSYHHADEAAATGLRSALERDGVRVYQCIRDLRAEERWLARLQQEINRCDAFVVLVGRDWLSEDMPNDTLNHVTAMGQDFSFPFCHQGDMADPDMGWGNDCRQYTQPAMLTGPHAGTLGMRFYNGRMFQSQYQGAIFIARHGPWNRSVKYGADIVVAWPDGKGGIARSEIFMSGLVANNEYLGRPVDVMVMKDGSMLVSDDHNGAIYRISYAP